MVIRTALGALLALSLSGVSACDGELDDAGEAGSLGMSIHALTTEACDSAGNGAALSEIAEVTLVVTGFDPAPNQDGEYEYGELVSQTRKNSGDSRFTLKDVPEGDGHILELFGTTADGATAWYGREPALEVRRNEDNNVQLLLTRFGGFNCAAVDDNSYTNVVFPAIVELADGRLMASGGFTQVVTEGANTYLAGPSSLAVIFDPRTGAVTGPFDMGVANARGAHAMAYVPSVGEEGSGSILIIGGMTRIRLDSKRAFPFVLGQDKTNVLKDAIVFDIDSGVFTELAETMKKKRAFPQAALMTDGTVIITGGGAWPEESDEEYKSVEIFDPNKPEGPGFLGIASFEGEVTRAGHAMTFLKNDENGQSHFLLWGGTSNIQEVAEVLRQSSQQREGVDGSFAAVTEGGKSPSDAFSSYFSQVTPLGNDQFLLTGGVTASGGALGSPRDDEAWLLTYTDTSAPGLTILKAPGFGTGRVFHSAGSPDGKHLSVVGGFTSVACGAECDGFTFPTITDGSIRFWDANVHAANPSDVADPLWVNPWSDAADSARFTARGGMAGHMIASRRNRDDNMVTNGAMLLVGGEPDLPSFTSATTRAVLEVYTPSNIPQPQP